MHAKTLTHQRGLSGHILEVNTRDVSHEESLVRPPKGGSCLNQVLGHLTRTRNLALSTMGQTAPFPMEEFAPYDDRTEVPFSPENALPFDELLRRFKARQENGGAAGGWRAGSGEVSARVGGAAGQRAGGQADQADRRTGGQADRRTGGGK